MMNGARTRGRRPQTSKGGNRGRGMWKVTPVRPQAISRLLAMATRWV